MKVEEKAVYAEIYPVYSLLFLRTQTERSLEEKRKSTGRKRCYVLSSSIIGDVDYKNNDAEYTINVVGSIIDVADYKRRLIVSGFVYGDGNVYFLSVRLVGWLNPCKCGKKTEKTICL